MASKFHERFDIDVGLEEARRRFVNRAFNLILESFIFQNGLDSRMITREIVTALGESYFWNRELRKDIKDDYYKTLQAVEACYHAIPHHRRRELVPLIDRLLKESEVDLGIRWEDERFVKSGAKQLDDALVNVPLHWLIKKGHESVLNPYRKGLEHFLHAEKRPELLADVITDMYEALEALSKIITERPNDDLSANKELFIKKVKASPEYKMLLSEYIEYANNFRHAVKEGKTKPALSVKEVESFIYLTGIFLRLAMS